MNEYQGKKRRMVQQQYGWSWMDGGLRWVQKEILERISLGIQMEGKQQAKPFSINQVSNHSSFFPYHPISLVLPLHFPICQPNITAAIHIINSNLKTMRNQKQTVLDMLINPRAGDNFDRKQSQKQLLQAITSKNQELNILHQVNTRLGYELSLLQKKLGIDPGVILRELEKIGEISLHYHAELGQLQYLDHLLLSYDQTILKQKKIIAMLYSQLQDFEKKSETIVRENEYLLQENKNKCKKILEIFHRGYPEENLTLSYNKLLRETEQERNDIIKQESEEVMVAYDQLMLHCENLERELEESNRAGEKYFESLKKQSEELKESLLSVDNLLKVKEFLEKTVNKLGEENIALETVKNQNQSRISKLQTQLKSVRNQLFTQKKINRDDNQRIAFELDSLKSQSQNAGKRQRETFNRNMILEKELETAKEALRGFKRENEKVKGELEQTLKMCETYESKITSQTRKEQNLVEILDKSKEKLDGLILQRDKALLKLQRLEKIIEDMNTKHREDQLKLRQTYEKMLIDQQQKLKIITDQKEETESIFLESQLTLKNQLQKLTRQNSLLREQNLKFIENIHVNTGSQIINKLKEYQAKNDSLLKLINQKQKQLKDQQNKSQETTHQYQTQIKNLNRLLEKEKNAATQYMKQITQQRSKTNILTNQKECLENQVKKLKKNYEYKNVQMNDDREFRIHELESKLNEAVKKEREVKARALEMLERYDETELRLKNHYEKIIGELEAENVKLKKKIEKAKAKRNE